jgi:hypothetical protein
LSTLAATSGRPDRRIALLKPAAATDERIAHALQLLDSILWAFQGTTRSTWKIGAPEVADVIVIHEADTDKPAQTWKSSGKLIVEIATEARVDTTVPNLLVYPFRAQQVLVLLEQLDTQLSSAGDASDASAADSPASEPETPADPWSFVEALRTLRSVQNSEAWLVGRDAKTPVLWLRGDAATYTADAGTVQAIRRGSFRLSKLTLHKGADPGASVPVDGQQATGPASRSGMELSWFAGYHASSQLAPGLQASACYRITQWPNFGLIRPLPSQLRVAAGLSAAAADLDEIIKRASVAAEEAVRTLNALYACGVLVSIESGGAAVRMTPGALAEPRGGFTKFLRSVRKHLGLGA